MGAEERAQNLFIRYSGVLLKTASNGSFFMDITDFRDLGTIRAKSAENVKFKKRYLLEEVVPLLKDLEKSNIKTHLEYFISFHNQSRIAGAHRDSVNLGDPLNGRASGADDNGSGIITILEVLPVLLGSRGDLEGKAENTIEFH
ncbi:hypothetical protein M430DRAFT_55765 [Amorphotheca resinae ATCC 22711]|uniref:Peptide hydrolase n=1 Tax=Amorphotheca resinae ATCC 22711 TaxID=857342 RepID=A0A2T3BG86_AMORE|nr:hypothetical protein M430DRAFT_55765 [Amorphotheca resinae ATCC 22711]PSS28437.1 hypothetical protein M430DRAFT_55765 [Amorphotheca resinae ATCC 22711]